MGRLLFAALMALAVRALMVVAWLDRTLQPTRPFPRDPDQLRTRRDWCVARAGAAGLLPENAEITGFSVTPFKTNEAFRSLVARVRIDHHEAGADHSVELLAKFAPPANDLRDQAVFILQENHTKETAVYARLAADPAVAAPAAYHAACHPLSGQMCLLLEFLGDCEEIPEAIGCPADRAGIAIDAMAALHGRFWNDDSPQTAALKVVPDIVIDHFGGLFQGEDAALFGDLLGKVWRHDGRAPTTVLHGDPRVANMLFATGDGEADRGRFAFIDWQAARKGKGVFDVAYFLVLSVEPEVRRAHEDALLQRYHDGLVRAGVGDYAPATLHDDYRHAILLVLAFVTLPMMSAESSRTSGNVSGLLELGEVWTRRMMAVVQDIDLDWVQRRLGVDGQALAAAFERSNVRGQQTLTELRARLTAHEPG